MGTHSTLDFLFPKARRDLLAVFLLHPGQTFHLRDLARRLKTGHGVVQRELAQLVRARILASKREGQRVLYQANADSYIFPELQRLIEKTLGPTGQIHEALAPLASKIQAAFIYGSIAARTAKESSDVDLVVIGDSTFEDVTEVLSSVQSTLQREINPTIYPVKEFQSKVARGNVFLKTVLQGPKDFVIGDPHVLESLV